MKCEICNINNADITLTIITNNNQEDLYICHECMQKLYLQTRNNSIDGLLTKLNERKSDNKIICNNCGTSYEDYLKTKKYGCAECYNVFKEAEEKKNQLKSKINDLINNVNSHEDKETNKKAADQDKQTTIAIEKYFDNKTKNNEHRTRRFLLVKEELEIAIKNENYEEAAKLRDKIKRIKNSSQGDINGSNKQ